MKVYCLFVLWAALLPVSVLSQNTNLNPVYLFATTNADNPTLEATNMLALGPYYPAFITKEMLRTNSFECHIQVSDQVPTSGNKAMLAPPVCWIYTYNFTTNYIACLRVPIQTICQVALLDKDGKQVQKTHSGEKFGRAFSEDEVRHWFKNWNNSHESMFISIIPNGSPPYGTPPYDIPTEIGFFALKDIFDLKENGEYELHVQLILTQAGKDSA